MNWQLRLDMRINSILHIAKIYPNSCLFKTFFSELITKYFFQQIVLQLLLVFHNISYHLWIAIEKDSSKFILFNEIQAYDEIIDGNTEFTKRLGFKITEKAKALPIMYWVAEIYKKPTAARFIIAFKLYSTKEIYKSVPNIFKLLCSQVENLIENANFL